ncbi:MAG: ornithine cyclodeaminase family protein [Actinobacteria bacterium]|nr:ornithine cyclodeaminase family protein [Actinomycetota bacterium]
MKALPFIDEKRLNETLGMHGAIDALERAFAGRLPTAPERIHLETGTGDLLLMPAWGEGSMGVKLVTVAPGNNALGKPLIQGIYVLFDKESLTPVALFDGAALTGLRTAALSGVATKYLARPDATKLVIFGAGTQARAHLEAIAAVRDIKTVRVVSRSPERASELGALAAGRFDADVADPEAVAAADVICTCTTSSTPVFDGHLLPPGVHINAVGSYKPSTRELDDAAIGSVRIVVDTPVALTESGDLRTPLESGVIQEEDIEELATVVARGRHRKSPDDGTLFKSVGSAFEDLVVAEAAIRHL